MKNQKTILELRNEEIVIKGDDKMYDDLSLEGYDPMVDFYFAEMMDAYENYDAKPEELEELHRPVIWPDNPNDIDLPF